MKALLRRLHLLIHYRRWAPVNPPYGLAIRDEDTPEVQAKIDALQAKFAAMTKGEIRCYLNAKRRPLVTAAYKWGRS